MRINDSMNNCLLVLLTVLTAVWSPMKLNALDKAEVWTLYREGESSFKQANELLQTDPAKARKLFEKAALSFEMVHREGGIENGGLFYNIGNLYFRLGNTGKAIVNYRRAERFMPNDINLQQNLNYARSRCVDKIEPKPQSQALRTIFFWHYDLGGITRAWLLAVFSGSLWLSAGMYLLRRRPWLRYMVVSCAVLSLSLACSLAVDAYEQANVRSGVVLQPEVMGRKGDSTTFEPTFKEPLHMGVEFNLVEERKGWLHIELADGRRCWIPESAAEMI
jgi:tetratricopeptide (TPR) repeat protein